VISVVSAIALGVMYQQKANAERAALSSLAEVREARDAEERNRQRADENFDHAREMARTFMNDVGDTLENLRGATKAREILLTTAREYLAKLNVQAGDRVDLLRDLADAQERVGELQGGLHAANTGASDEAAVSFASSRKIREELLQRVPNEWRSHADMARSLARSAGTLVVGKKYAQAVQEYGSALKAWDASIGLSKDAAESQRLRDSRAQTLVRLANATYLQVDGGNAAGDGEERVQAALGMYEEAATYWRARLEGSPNDPRPTRWLGIVEDSKCRAHVWLANALRDGAAKSIDKDRAAAKARLLKAIERYAFARSKADAALEEFRSLAAGAAANADFARDQYLALHNIGVTWMEQSEALTQLKKAAPEDGAVGKRILEADRAALGSFEQALAIAEGLSTADLANIEAVRDVVICLNKVGNQKLALGDLAGSGAAYDRSLEVRRGLVQTDPTPMHRRDLGLALFKRGRAFQKEGDAAAGGGPGTKLEKYRAAEALLAEAERVFAGLRDDGVRDQGGDDLGKTRELLADVRKSLAATAQ
jgi:tetratricopeptide (TPR) repeat protein